MSFSEFLSLLRARWRTVVLTFLVVFGVTLGLSIVWPKTYTAAASVLIDVKNPDPIAGVALPGLLTPSYMITQGEIITSSRVAQRVVKDLNLTDDAKMRELWLTKGRGVGTFEAFYADALRNKLEVKPARESNVLTVKFDHRDPKVAAQVANAFAQAYVETNVELRADPAKRFAGFFDERTKQLRENLEKATAALREKQQQKGIVISDERVDIETRRLDELSTLVNQLQAQRIESSARNAQVNNGSGESMNEVLQNSLIQSLKNDLNQRDAKLRDLASRYGPEHPDYVKAEAEMQSVRARLASESAKATGSVAANARVNNAREAEARAALNQQREKVLQLKAVRDELSFLQRDVDTAQKAYDAVAQRQSQSTLESQVQQSNVMILTPANEPFEPSKPKVLLNAIIGAFAGTLLGVALALMFEMMKRPVRTAEQLSEALNIPVLAALDKAKIGESRLLGRRNQPLMIGQGPQARLLP